jgi:hypothetical protein
MSPIAEVSRSGLNSEPIETTSSLLSRANPAAGVHSPEKQKPEFGRIATA